MSELNVEAALPPYNLDSNNSLNESSDGGGGFGPLSDDMMRHIIDMEMNTRHFKPVTQTILVLCYSILITFGALGNGLVIFVSYTDMFEALMNSAVIRSDTGQDEDDGIDDDDTVRDRRRFV
ncbi:orphan G-protein coupled receptor 62 [Elysia marginata]|uniref:Orphan G-protein coupled receptor 62 n=1 Tax=Elysia marginata TaxID=1093978 RepID=A0AAV4HND0_9GAST|nr:orphan G-protein coupled receptor 62 [Elysia marginata]